VAPPGTQSPINSPSDYYIPPRAKACAHFLSFDVKCPCTSCSSRTTDDWGGATTCRRRRGKPRLRRSFALPAPGVRGNLRYQLALVGFPGLSPRAPSGRAFWAVLSALNGYQGFPEFVEAKRITLKGLEMRTIWFKSSSRLADDPF
jgi:hypothetical protein